jgi:DNA-binding transcriptional LysR family regulator
MPLRVTLRQLEYLVAVSDCGSVALAAERVSVSSPSISAAISQLEQDFGLQLFVRRHAQGLTPTEAGRRFVVEARQVLAAAGRLTDLANEITGSVRGPLAVGCLLTVAQIVLPRLRRSFSTLYPDVDFRQFEGDQAELFDGLRHGRLDVAVTYDLDIPADLRFVALVSLPPHAILPEDHPLARRVAVSPADLAPLPMVLLDLPFSADYFLSLFAQRGLRPRIAERTRDMGLMRAMVANGFGYSIANIRLQPDTAPDGRPLHLVPLQDANRPLPPLALGLVLPEGAEGARRLRAFVDHCRSEVPAALES